MGMTIDDFYWSKKYQQLQADYETRLKADMVAMLTELRQDIIAESWHIENLDINANDLYDLVVQISDVDKVIQQKINALKEQKNEP